MASPVLPDGPGLTRNLAAILQRIHAAAMRAGRDPAGIRILAVTKNQDPGVLPQLLAAGLSDCGENRLDHLAVMAAAAPPGIRFHAIGRVQGRQLAKLLPWCVALHSLCEPDHVDRLARAARQQQRRLQVFVQVNTAGEAQKAGLAPDALPALLDLIRSAGEVLDLQGLMTMAPDLGLPGVTPDQIRRCFAHLRGLAERHGLARLSMGMSGDFEIAVEEGATDLRLGSVLFAT